MLGFFKNNFKLLKISIKDLILFEIILKAMFFILILPISTILIKLTYKISGYKYLTNDVLFSYLKNPITITIFIIILLLNLLYLLLEYYCITKIMHLNINNKRLKQEKFIKQISYLMLNTFRPKNIGFLLLVPIYGLITNIMIWFSLSTATKIPYKITRYLTNNPIYILIICIFVIIVYLLGMMLMFAIHFYALNKSSFVKSIKYSIKIIKDRYLKFLWKFIIWNIIILLIIILLYLLSILLLILIINIMKINSHIQMAVFLKVFKYLNYVILIIGSVFSVLMNFSFIANLYNKYHLKRFSEEFRKNSRPSDDKQNNNVILAIVVTFIISVGMVTSYFILNDTNVKYWIGLKTPQITSHRGSSYYAPENTLLAIEYAVRDLANYVEIDAQQTKDGKIVIIHDTSLKRTTGVDKKINEVTYDEIKDLDAGKWFDNNLQDAKIPTLDEVLEYCKGKIKLNIEIKGYKYSNDIEEKVVKIIEKYGMEKDCVITSFNYNSLKKVKKLNNNIKSGYIISSGYDDFSKLKYADFFSMRATSLTPNMVKEIHSFNKQVHVWTVNNPNQIRKLMRMGVDNIITDNPILANEVINSVHSSTTLLEVLGLILK